jgi:hypothetical protein
MLRALPIRAEVVPTAEVMGSTESRILWIFPNYRTVDEEKSIPGITAREKWTIAAKDSFDPYAFPVAGLFAGISQWQNSEPSWGRGADGYGKRYVAALGDQTMSNLMAEGLFPTMLKQDPRFFRLGRGGFWHRLGYSSTRVFVTRTDSGEAQFNYSEFGGNAVMAGFSNVYYPAQSRTFGNTAGRFGTQIAFDVLANVSKEFWPDIKRWLVGK